MGKKSKIANVASAVYAVNQGLNLYNDYRDRWMARRTYTATVPEDAFIYRPLLKWVNSHVHTRAVRFYSTRDLLERLYDSEGRTEVNIGGHYLYVSLKKPSFDLGGSGPVELSSDSNPFAKSLVFQTTDPNGIDALENFLLELRDKETRREREIWVYRPGSYGWSASDFTYRDIDSIFLAGDDKERLLGDIRDFMSNEERYHRMGIPWHRGYLLYGPPGNGKSSLAAAVAHKERLNLYNMPLSTVKDDKTLTDLISSIEEDSILLIEDIDIFSKSVTRESENESGPTLAGLLNSLDGVGTPNGLISWLNTNVPDTLDPALVRPGRVDFRLELKAPVESQITGMFERIYDEDLGGKPKSFESMAELADVFKRHPDSVELARAEVLTEPYVW